LKVERRAKRVVDWELVVRGRKEVMLLRMHWAQMLERAARAGRLLSMTIVDDWSFGTLYGATGIYFHLSKSEKRLMTLGSFISHRKATPIIQPLSRGILTEHVVACFTLHSDPSTGEPHQYTEFQHG
jgi:hypothetical protein